MKRTLATALAAGLLLSLTTACEIKDEYRDACEAAGGTVETDREKKTRTTTVNGKRKTETYYESERECIGNDGRELIEDEEDWR